MTSVAAGAGAGVGGGTDGGSFETAAGTGSDDARGWDGSGAGAADFPGTGTADRAGTAAAASRIGGAGGRLVTTSPAAGTETGVGLAGGGTAATASAAGWGGIVASEATVAGTDVPDATDDSTAGAGAGVSPDRNAAHIPPARTSAPTTAAAIGRPVGFIVSVGADDAAARVGGLSAARTGGGTDARGRGAATADADTGGGGGTGRTLAAGTAADSGWLWLAGATGMGGSGIEAISSSLANKSRAALSSGNSRGFSLVAAGGGETTPGSYDAAARSAA